MVDHAPNAETPALPLNLLDPPETESQPQPTPGGGGFPLASHPECVAYHPGIDLQVAAIKAQLDDHEKDIRQPSSLSVTFRHTGWVHNRTLIAAALRRTNQSFSRRQNYANCGSDAYILRSIDQPNLYRLAGSACHDRFCQPCGQERSQSIALNVLELTKTKHIRFLTLTLKASDDPLATQLDKLYDSFSTLRRRSFWKKRVTGGVAFLEFTWSTKSDAWHPHFHILIEGTFLPHRPLSQLWHEITGDSFVVDIRAIKDRRTASRYVTKYASKPFNNTFLNHKEHLDEAITATKGRKLLLTFGTWRGITLIDTPSDGSWEHVAPLETIIVQAAHGDAEARALLRALTDRDLTALYERAPPLPPPKQKPTPPISQLDWFGSWNENATYSHPRLLLKKNRLQFSAPAVPEPQPA